MRQLGHVHDGLGGDCKEEARNVDYLGPLQNADHAFTLDMSNLVIIGGPKVSHQRTVLSSLSEQTGTSPSRRCPILEILYLQSIGGSNLTKAARVFVLPYAANKDSRMRRQDPLGSSHGVLSRTTSRKQDIIISRQLFISTL